ncbi:MAG: hypothetical protein FWG13_00475 [Leptospirales bacterium]|nr:hypothetical protein [Leptospirales bacterium]
MIKAGETANNNPQSSSWQKRPSEIKGYKVCYYITDRTKKDYIRVDANPKFKKVRLYIEVSKQENCPYFSVIVDGKVITEKNMLNNRSSGFSGVFSERASIVSTLPDEDIIELFGGSYGVKSPETAKEGEREKRLRETKEKYFVKESQPDATARTYSYDDGEKQPFFKSLFIGLIDVILGAALSVSSFFIFGRSFTALGVCLALYGAILGGIDFFIREKPSNVFKLLLFLLAGFASFIYGYYII